MSNDVLNICKYIAKGSMPTEKGTVVMHDDDYRFVPIEIGCIKNVVSSVKELLFPAGGSRSCFEHKYPDGHFVLEVPVDSFVGSLRSNRGSGRDAALALENLPYNVANAITFPSLHGVLQIECHPLEVADRGTINQYVDMYFV